MGKVTTYCQISACSPETYRLLNDYDDEYSLVMEDPGEGGERIRRTREALDLLLNADELEGHQAISIIGNHQVEPLWEVNAGPPLEALIRQAKGHVRVISDWMMGGEFDMGFASSSTGDGNSVLVSFGCCFFVQTYMLPILEAATAGRVSPQRLWELAMRKGHFSGHGGYALPGVDYGVISQYLEQFPWYLGNIEADVASLHELGDLGRPEDIAKVMGDGGFWMWMRPDRFPIDSIAILKSSQSAFVSLTVGPKALGSISKLSPEIIQLIVQYLPLHGIVALSMLNKALYYQLLGNPETRNAIARMYINARAPWYLPYGEIELKWWKERNGDGALGWEYLRRCWSESHSMRNRKRVWRAAQSIEEQCELEEAKDTS